MKRLLFLIIPILLLPVSSRAGVPVQFALPDTTIIKNGTAAFIPLYVDSSLTGLNVTSYTITITFNTSAIQIDSAYSTGTLTAAWGSPVYHVSSGQITVAGAGTTALSGTGVLLMLRVTEPAGSTGTYSQLNFSSALLDEGTPTTTTINGYINIQYPPVLTIYPSIQTMTVKDTLQFSACCGTPPYTWSTNRPSVATVDAWGNVAAVHQGFFTVSVRDTSGTIGVSDSIEVRAYKLSFRDTSVLEGQTFVVPVIVSDLSQIQVTSGQFSVSYNSSLFTALGIQTTGSLLASAASSSAHVTSGVISISFATSTPLSGSGPQVLCYIQFQATSQSSGSSSLSVSDLLFNENLPGNSITGTITVNPAWAISVSPNSGILVAGDSLKFSAYGTMTGPLTWSVSNPTLASITSSGMLHALHGGSVLIHVSDSVGHYGSSGTVNLYDLAVGVQNTIAMPNGTFDFNVVMGQSPVNVSSAQITISFDTSKFHYVQYTSAGTLTNGWSSTSLSLPGQLTIIAAGTTNITGPGTIFKVRFTIPGSVTGGPYAINTTNILLNEGNPSALGVPGTITMYYSSPPPPVLASPVNGAPNQWAILAFRWHPSSWTLNYQIEIDDTVTFTHPSVNDSAITDTSVSPPSLNTLTTYFWRVRAGNGIGLSSWSDIWQFTTGAGIANCWLSILSGWNMLSAPLKVADSRADILFRDATSRAFAYENGYVISDTIDNGFGYWLKFPAAELINQAGSPCFIETVNVKQGWNMIGSISVPISCTSITSIPSNLVTSTFFGYSGSYFIADTIYPGMGYWARVTQSGQFILSSGSPMDIQAANRIKIVPTDEVPPPPPGGSLTGLGVPKQFALDQNYPNPFNPATKLQYALPLDSKVRLTVYNLLGQVVTELVNGVETAGYKSIEWNAPNFSSGVYFYKLDATSTSEPSKTFTSVKKMLLIK